MARKLLAAAAILVVLGGGAAAVAYVVHEKRNPDPIEKRGSSRQEFDRSEAPKAKAPPPRKMSSPLRHLRVMRFVRAVGRAR